MGLQTDFNLRTWWETEWWKDIYAASRAGQACGVTT